jgi:translation initiation factor eIF-2B subunit epsilon
MALLKGSVVEAGVTMNGAILCNNVVVKSGAVLHPGTVLSFHTVIDTNVEVPSNTRVTMKDKNKIFGENGTILISKTDNNDIHSDIQIVGNGGRGCSWNNKGE